jgi:hypothetical protein
MNVSRSRFWRLEKDRIYRVIHKSLRDFRPLRYSSRDGHSEGDHVNRGRDTPSFCPTLQVLDMCTVGDAADVNPVIKFLRHALQRVSRVFRVVRARIAVAVVRCAFYNFIICLDDNPAYVISMNIPPQYHTTYNNF